MTLNKNENRGKRHINSEYVPSFEIDPKNMIDTLITFFKKPASQTTNACPEGLCPNCWGKQEYDNQVREMYIDKQIDVNNHEANHAFIQDFVVTQIKGIRLIKTIDKMECPTCHMKA